MAGKQDIAANDLVSALRPATPSAAPDPEAMLYDCKEPPPFPDNNVFPIEWRTETPKLWDLYNKSRYPGWAAQLLAAGQPAAREFYPRPALRALLLVCSALRVRQLGPRGLFSRDDPRRRPVTQMLLLDHPRRGQSRRGLPASNPDSDPGRTAGLRARNPARPPRTQQHQMVFPQRLPLGGFKKGVQRLPLPILFSAFLMGEVASSTLLHTMYQRTAIPVFKEAFRRVGQDEARHMGICMTVVREILPRITDEQRAQITKQVRAGYVFLSGILYEAPDDFWELPETFRPAHRLLEETAREAGLGILTLDKRRENWRDAVLKLKGILDPHGIEFPAIPEIGVDGKTVAFDPDDIIPMF